MYPQVTPLSLFAALLLLLSGHSPLDAQEWRARAISSVIHYRASVLGDTATKFDGCRVAQHVDETTTFAEPVERMLRPCEAVGARDRHTVRVDSLTRGDEGDVMVYLTVIRGEWVHREDYALIAHDPPSTSMGVREVRGWGAVQAYPRRPGIGNSPG